MKCHGCESEEHLVAKCPNCNNNTPGQQGGFHSLVIGAGSVEEYVSEGREAEAEVPSGSQQAEAASTYAPWNPSDLLFEVPGEAPPFHFVLSDKHFQDLGTSG